MHLVTIGGGEISDESTLNIDHFICGLTGRTEPKALFIPTASSDAVGYCENFRSIYGGKLGCKVDELTLCKDTPSENLIRRKIEWADLIYVGGGNTRKLLDVWEQHNVGEIIKETASERCVLSGLSAGAICWYESGLSDADRFRDSADWSFISIDGLGWLPGTFCPHLDAESRHGALIDSVFSSKSNALACDNGAAIHWHNSHAKVLSATSRSYAYQYSYSSDGVLISRYGDGSTIDLSTC